MSDELIAIRVDRTRDPGGAKLRAVLEAQFAYERARRVRRRWLALSAVALVVPWFALHTAAVTSAAVAALRAVVVLRTALAGLVEWLRQRRWSQALAQD